MARLTMEDNQPFVLDHRIVLNDGLTRWVHVRGNVTRDDKGKPLLFVGVTQDITERKMAEERFRLVVESTPNAMALVNN